MIQIQTIIVLFITLILGFFAGKFHKKKKLKSFCFTIYLIFIVCCFHAYTMIKPVVIDHKIKIEQHHERMDNLFEEFLRDYNKKISNMRNID